MSHHEHPDKKHKKLLKIFKNRHLRDMAQQAEVHQRNRDLDREREEELRDAALASSRAAANRKDAKSQDTFRKLDEIRKHNSHRSRVAADRWNRFAGTETGGGRGL